MENGIWCYTLNPQIRYDNCEPLSNTKKIPKPVGNPPEVEFTIQNDNCGQYVIPPQRTKPLIKDYEILYYKYPGNSEILAEY